MATVRPIPHLLILIKLLANAANDLVMSSRRPKTMRLIECHSVLYLVSTTATDWQYSNVRHSGQLNRRRRWHISDVRLSFVRSPPLTAT